MINLCQFTVYRFMIFAVVNFKSMLDVACATRHARRVREKKFEKTRVSMGETISMRIQKTGLVWFGTGE